jgi:Ca2+-binding RTX toxin-like protein
MSNPQNPTVKLPESGEFNFYTNVDKAHIGYNYRVTYERLHSSNPNAPEYQLKISAAVGTGAEFLARISTSITYEAGLQTLIGAVKAAVATSTGGLGVGAVNGVEFYAREQADPVFYKYLDSVGNDASNLFADSAIGLFSKLSEAPESPQIPISNSSNPTRQTVTINSTNSQNQTTTITATKSTNPATNKSSVSISSNNYNKSELTESSKSLIQNEGSNLIGSNLKIEGSDGIINGSLLNNSLLSEAEKFLAKNTKLDAPILTETDSNGNPLYLIKSDEKLTLSDGSSATLKSIVNTIDSTSKTIQSFLLGSANFGKNLLDSMSEIFNNEKPNLIDEQGNPILDENGNQLKGASELDYMIGEFVARVVNGESAQSASIDIAGRKVAEKISEQLAAEIGGSSNVQAGVAIAIARIGLAQINGEDQNSDDYALVATQAILAYFGVNPAISAAIINSTKKILEEDGKFNSDGYQDVVAIATTSFVVAMICIKIGAAVGTAIGGPVGFAVGVAVGAIVGYLIAEPVYNAVRNGWEDSEQIYDALEDIFKGDDIDDQLKEALKGVEDLAKDYTIDFIKDVGRGAITLFTGRYGKELKDGQYWNPYPSLNITPKADGTGNIIQGLDPQGVTAIAREYYHDDIYGTRGSDNLIGKSGTNTIAGYEGNDHIEGRGDIDLLIGGAGDDEIFGGNGDDQLYGSEGNDNLFGGNGNDIIIGGTGASISGEGSLEDGADFIQGGNGDDQIMGEAGNDQIQGNSGNDTILGGTGNDRIEGNEGDDSILGEEGDDMILGGVGSDIIDGGSGTDYIEGNEGNDNIRGGDGNDEISGNSGVDIIYGDAGNDLINSGSDNDLVFGGLGNDIIYGAEGDDTLSGELGNDYLIGGDGNDTIDGGAGDDILFGGTGNDIITTGEGNDTIIYRLGDGQDTITDTDTSGNDILRLTEINSKLSDNTTNKLILTKSGTDLIIEFKDDSNLIITTDKITITNQFGGSGENGTGSEILKKIEFADQKAIDLTSITINGDDSISYTTSTYENIDTSIQEELALGYNDQMQYQDEQENPDSTYNANNYNNSGEQEEIDSEKYNEMQWRSKKEKRSAFGGHYTVWYKYYEKNLSGTSGNDRIVGHWWSENVYGGNGDDQLHGGDGNDNLFGGEGSDILHGGAGIDNIYGQAGEDLIYGGSGNDYLDGGADNDTIYGNEGNDTIIGNSGDDYLEGNGGNDSITDNEGNNVIIAGSGFDIITTGAGNDKIEGNDDADNINAGDGNNLVYGNGGNDAITTGSGNDTIYGQEGFDLINAGAGDDYISGGAGDDVINGEDGNDIIYGDTGIDQISGGNGNDYIWGGSGVDILKGDAGNDQIKGGDSDDLIEGGEGDDFLYGQSGSDKIYGGDGNDAIDGGIEGDVLEGGAGDDTILGGQGNDILVDGAGSDVLDGGDGSDIIILTTEIDVDGNTTASTSVDTIKNFNKDEDKIILKASYKTPISFADIQSNMTQNGSNVEISLNNGQKIIIENIATSDITSSNFQIGLSGGANNDILFGTDGEDVLFGDEGDDKIYGGEGNDELWGGKGSDELYGEGGDDILRYEADGKYQSVINAVYSDEYVIVQSKSDPNIVEYKYYSYSPLNGYNAASLNAYNDTLVSGYNFINLGEISRYIIPKLESLTKDRPEYQPNGRWIIKVTKIDFNYSKTDYFATKNFYNSQLTDITGYNRTFDKFLGGEGVNTILMTEGNDVLALDDATSASGSSAAGTSTSARVQDISVIHAGAGDDVINFSTQKYSYGDTVVYGGTGNDKIWLSSGNDQVFGGEGNDEIYSGAGSDQLNGGSGDDVLFGGTGNDTLEGGSGTNQLFGEDGDDTFIAGSGADTINGGAGNDTVSYVNSTAAVSINLATNSVSGGEAENAAANDTISSIENVIGSAFNDTLIGSDQENILNGGSGDDALLGGLASDTYIYNFGGGIDTITESGNSEQGTDVVKFGAGIFATDLTFAVNGNDLEIQVGSESTNKIILKNQLLESNHIEYLQFADGSEIGALSSENSNQIAISNKFFITSEDQELSLTAGVLNLDSNKRFNSLTAIYGTLVFDEALNQFTYKGNSNFHGIDEITLIDEDENISKFTIFINGINDAPIFSELGKTPNKEVKVEEEFSINLRDYFTDADGDKLTLSLKLQGFDNLPDWINFNQESGIVSGKIGRDGKLNFTVSATDQFGAQISDNFRVNITRNIAEDMRPTTPVVEMLGTDAADVITATENSSDIILAGAGDDIINYTKDNDWVEASDGSYYVAWNVYSGDEITVTGKQRSFDAFDGGDGYDKLNLTNQNDTIFLDDAIVSNVGDIAKLSSIEEINAGDGDDVIDLTSLTFSYDDVVLNGGNGNDVLWGNDGDDTINGDAGDDNLQGGKGNDVINGGSGNDTIKGYDGDDQINGGAGFDVMTGGNGSDQFIFTDKADSTGSFTNLSETDIISDFIQNEDQIDLSALGFDSITQGQGSNSSANGLEFYFKDGYTVIDDPNSNFAVKLAGEIQLGASDFNF